MFIEVIGKFEGILYVETCPTSKGIATGSSICISFSIVETCPTSKGIATHNYLLLDKK